MSDKPPPPASAGTAGSPALHLIVAQAAPPADPEAQVLRQAFATLALPGLDALLRLLSPGAPDAADDDSLSPPHERAMAHALGLPVADGLIPWAARAAHAAGLPDAHAPGWAWITPCHWQVGMNEVRQHDPAGLLPDAAESAAFREAVRPWFAGDGIALHAGPTPGAWLAHGAPLAALPSASLDRVIGRDIDTWKLGGDAGRPLRRLQQEMQMFLYTHALNDARECLRRPPVNSFWISGTGDLPTAWAGDPQPAPQLDRTIADAWQAGHVAGWTAAWQALDARLATTLLPAARAGRAVTLTLCGERASRSWTLQPGGWIQQMRRRIAGPDRDRWLDGLS
ncbi:MAG: hypothetical protein J0H69_10380 [Burkholderiales bacterium]|nr:hypothetical protein [Burkholderiales bacterium]